MFDILKTLLILILCAFACSCRSTKTVKSSNESERNAVVQAQWRFAQKLSFSSTGRNTAMSFDSCVFTFGGADTSATHKYKASSYPLGKPQKENKAKPSFTHGKPTKIAIYGLHLSQEEKEKSVAKQEVEDSIAKSMQSSFGKSQKSIKSKISCSFTAMVTIALIMAAAIFLYIRHRHNKAE